MNQAQRIEFLEQSRAHFAADELLRGWYAKRNVESFKGCSVGCHLHHILPKATADEIQYLDNKHEIVAKHYGYPEWLARLQDMIFEGLPNGASAAWHVQLAEVLAETSDDYDWQAALHRVHAAILRVALKTAGEAKDVVQRVLDLHERAAAGEDISGEKWSAARSAAWSAARSAAWSAARSAARSAAESEESAAESAAMGAARSAAESEESAAESAAMGAAYQDIRDGVLSALRNVKVSHDPSQ